MGYERRYGDVPDNPVGTTYKSRAELYEAGLHDHLQAGISGQHDESADAIVLSGGYPDGDHGDEIIYTGQGGQEGDRNKRKKKQVADQSESTPWNRALINSELDGSPVRVIRGPRRMTGSPYSPVSGYRYDGLYRVLEHWFEPAEPGSPFQVLRFRLVKIGSPADMGDAALLPAPGPESEAQPSVEGEPTTDAQIDPEVEPDATGRAESRTSRLIRRAAVVRRVKGWYDSKCQICGITVELPNGPYAEGAHIQGLGKKHEGPDWTRNMLCLCPTDHVRFDYGAIYLTDDFKVVDRLKGAVIGDLTVHEEHKIELKYVQYHRVHIAKQPE